MATFPLDLASFFSTIEAVSTTFDLSENVNLTRTAGGSSVPTEYGTRRWYGSVTLRRLPNYDAERTLAQVRMLMSARASFLVSPIHYKMPVGPGGSVTLNSVANAYECRLGGLPNGFQAVAGVFFTIVRPGRRTLHQITEGGTVSGGITPLLTVEPAIAVGWAAGQTVEMNPARVKARYVPGSFQAGAIRSVITDGASFDWEETL